MNTQSNTRNGLARVKGEGARINNSLNADQRWAVGKWIENNRALCEQLSADQLAAECTKQLGFSVSSCTANRQRNVVHPDLKGRGRSSNDGLLERIAELEERIHCLEKNAYLNRIDPTGIGIVGLKRSV